MIISFSLCVLSKVPEDLVLISAHVCCTVLRMTCIISNSILYGKDQFFVSMQQHFRLQELHYPPKNGTCWIGDILEMYVCMQSVL